MFDRSFDLASFDAHEGPMLCCSALPLCIDCQTVADTRRVVGSCWLCGSHRSRAAAAAAESTHTVALKDEKCVCVEVLFETVGVNRSTSGRKSSTRAACVAG